MTHVNSNELTTMIVQAHNPSHKTKKRKAAATDGEGSPPNHGRGSAFAATESAQTSPPQTRQKTHATRGLHASPDLPQGDNNNGVLFPSAMEAYRQIRASQRPSATQSSSTRGGAPPPAVEKVQSSSVIQPPPPLGIAAHMGGASKTRWQEHQRRLKQASALMSTSQKTGGGIRKTHKSSSSTPTWRRNVLGRLVNVMRGDQEAMMHPASTTTLDPDVTGEFDRDVSEAMVTIGGKFVGLDPEELMHSQGLRKLVARNIQWFQRTPDWLKLIGLVVAKRLNSAVRTATGGGGASSNEASSRIEGLDDLPVTLPPSSPPPSAFLTLAAGPTEDAEGDTDMAMMIKVEEDAIPGPPPPPPPTQPTTPPPVAPKKKSQKKNKKEEETLSDALLTHPPSLSEEVPNTSFF